MAENKATRTEKYRQIRKQLLANAGRSFKFLSIDEKNVEAVVEHPGLTYSDYDVNGQPKLWNMMNVAGAARHFAHHYRLDESGRTFRDFLKMTEDRFTFMVSSELTFTKEMYDPSISKINMRVHVKGGYIGSSSLNSISEAFTQNDNVLLMKNITQIVSVDKETRRPKPLPDWWREKYAESAKGHVSLRFENFSRPEEAASYKCKIAWSDTDAYRHTNWASYARFCVDAAHIASVKGDLKQFEDNVANGLRMVQLNYIKETLHDDELVVYVWEDETDSKVILFEIYKGDNAVFKSKFFFH